MKIGESLKLDEISKKLAFFENANKKMEDLNSIGLNNVNNLKSNLRDPKSPAIGNKKNVRFIDE